MGADKKVTHKTLVRAGAQWLISKGYCVTAMEMACPLLEQPDVIGWSGEGSALIECKIGRSDFFSDEKKIHRRADMGIGELRWYLVPEGLVTADELPPGWGLLEYRTREYGGRGYYIRRIAEPERRELTDQMLRNERMVLVSIARRSLEAVRLVKPLMLGNAERHDEDNLPGDPEG